MIFFPSFRRVLGWVEIAESVRFWFDNLNLTLFLHVNCISLGCYAIPIELATLEICIPIQLVNFKDRPRQIVRIETLKSFSDGVDLFPCENAFTTCTRNCEPSSFSRRNDAKRIC